MLRDILAASLSSGVPKRSLIVAVIVGSILTLINQYDALFGNVAFDWLKAGLTCCVPYCVSTYGAVTQKLYGQQPPERA